MDYQDVPNIRDLGGYNIDLIRYPDVTDAHWGATNPSIGFNGKSVYATTIRSSNYYINKSGAYVPFFGDKFLSRVYFSEFDRDWKLKKLRQIDFDGLETEFLRGVEDAKLFYRDGWFFTAVVMEKKPEGIPAVARLGVFELNTRKNKVESFHSLPGRDPRIPEKNWMIPYEPTEFFDFVYGPNQIVTGHMIQSWMSDSEAIHNLRGSSNLLLTDDDTYLGVMHRTFFNTNSPFAATTFAANRHTTRDYVHYFVRFDKHGYIVEIGPGFRFHQPGVEFAAGLVEKGKDFVVSFGRNDVSSHLGFIPKDTVLQSLTPVEY